MKNSVKKKQAKQNEEFFNNENFNLSFCEYKYFPHLIFSSYFILLSILSLLFHKIGDYGVETDFYWEYVPQAKEILNGILAFDSYRGPIYQLILALFGFLFGRDFFHAGIIINVLFASLTLVLIFKTIDLISNKEIAFLTVLFTATNQHFIKYSYCCGTDMVYMFIYFLAVYYFLKSKLKISKYILLSGLFCSIAYLTRYTALSLIFAVFLILIYQIIKEFYAENKLVKGDYNQLIKKTILFYIPNFLIISIWSTISYIYKGRFFYNDNFLNTALTVYKPVEMTTGEWTDNYQSQFHSMTDVIFKDFGMFFKKIFVDNLTSYFVLDMEKLIPWYLGIFVSIGLILFLIKFRKINFNEKYFLFINLMFYFILTLIFYTERFSIPLLPFFSYLIIFVFSFNYLKNTAQKKSLQKLSLIFIGVLFFVNLYNSSIITKNDISSGPQEILLISDWVNNNFNNGLKGKKLMARKPQIAYYTDAIFTPFLIVSDYKDLLSKIKKDDVDFLYTSYNELSAYGRKNNFLIDVNNIPKELEIIYYLPEYKAVLYRVKK